MNIFDWLAVNFDLPILEWIANNLRNPFLDFVMPIITVLGDAGIFWIACAVLFLIFPKTRKMGLTMGASLLIGLLLCNVTLKPLIGRVRPYAFSEEYMHYLMIGLQSDGSFPSGHTIASFEAATAICIYNRKLGTVALVLAVLIAFSRLYLFVHYPTDVLTSVVLGVGIAFLANFLVKKGYAMWEARKQKA